MRYILALSVLMLLSCQPKLDTGQDNDAFSGHLHEDGRKPSLDYTVWTGKTELFVEFPALVVGETSLFAAHFTFLDGHQPVKEGSVTVSLIKGTQGIRHSVAMPSSPGIFTPSLQPKESGIYELVFELKTPNEEVRIGLKDIVVYATVEEAQKALSEEEENGNVISFLKEQAWRIEFQTVPAVKKEIYQTIQTSGVWKAAPSDYKTLIAPSAGQVSFSKIALTEGSAVRKGQVLMTISSAGMTSNNLDAEIQKARAEFTQAVSEYDRKKELFESKIVPKAEFERVEQRYLVAKTNYETLNSGYIAGGKQITSSVDGFIKSINTSNGAFASQGDVLVTVTNHKSNLLEVQVSPEYSRELENIHDLWYQPKSGHWSSLMERGGKILSVSREVEKARPLISVFAEVNELISMPEGSFTEAQLSVGQSSEGLVVPISSLLEDYGNFSVIVQLSGESFELRNVQVGKRNGHEVEIVRGLSIGEVVVTKGAYQVKMVSMSGKAPAHGHAH